MTDEITIPILSTFELDSRRDIIARGEQDCRFCEKPIERGALCFNIMERITKRTKVKVHSHLYHNLRELAV